MREALAMRAPVLPVRRNIKGPRLEATDLDWATGEGPTVTGPGEAILLAITGRSIALDGPGVSTLRQRVTPA